MNLKERFESFKLFESNICICTPCFEVVLFNSGTLKDLAPDLSLLIHRFLDTFGKEIRLYNTASNSTMQATSAKAFRQIVNTNAILENKEETYGMDAHAGISDNDATPPALQFFYDGSEPDIPHTYFRGVLTDTFAIDRPDELFKDILSLVDDFPFLHGYAGYSFFWRTLDPFIHERVTSVLRQVLKRHPGFGYGNPLEFSELALDGVVAVNWLTMLGKNTNEKLGGAEKIGKLLPAEVQISDIGSGTILKLGNQPEIGDRNRQESLPVYKKVGGVLSTVHVSSDEVWIDGLDPEDEMEVWFDRFFK